MTDAERLIIYGLLLEVKAYVDKSMVIIDDVCTGMNRAKEQMIESGEVPPFYALLNEQIERLK